MDFRNNVVRVTAKPLWGFTPKNWEERSVPLPTGLMERLRKLKNQNTNCESQSRYTTKCTGSFEPRGLLARVQKGIL